LELFVWEEAKREGYLRKEALPIVGSE